MLYEDVSSEDDWKKKQKEMTEALANAAKKSGSSLLKKVVDERKKEEDPERMRRCRMAHMVFGEAIDMYEDGSSEWDKMVDDLAAALKAI